VNGIGQSLSINNIGSSTTFFTTGTTTAGDITLGGGGANSFDLYELIQYDGALTTSQRQQVEGYLAIKWGLSASLPSSHPYYTSGPMHSHFTKPAGLPSAVPTSVKNITGFNPGIRATGLQIYSCYNGGSRGGNYTIYYSDDNINFTAAFSGNVSSSACGIIAGSGTGDGSYGYRHYWKFTMTGVTNGHFPRSSRIDLLAGNTVYNLITFASDNCSDTGKIPGLDYATTITNSYF
jgi:hypothetical protein